MSEPHPPPTALGAPLVVVLCDAGPRLGVGHVMRCLALAEELVARGIAVTLVADLAEVPWVADQVRRRGVEILPPVGEDPVAARIELVRALAPSAVVVDSYLLPSRFYDTLYAAGATHGWRVLALIDGDPADRVADLYLDQNIGAEHDDWPIPDFARRLAGLDYALLRGEVTALRPAAPRSEGAGEAGAAPRVLAFFGGTDAYAVAPRTAELLVATGTAWEATVVAATPAIRAALDQITTAPGQRLTVIEPTDDLPALVTAADVVVSAAGTSSWELLCLGAAAAFVCVADNQRASYRRIIEERLGVGLGTVADLGTAPSGPARAALAALLTDPERRASLRRAAWSRVDGRGRMRVADALLSVPEPVAGPVEGSVAGPVEGSIR